MWLLPSPAALRDFNAQIADARATLRVAAAVLPLWAKVLKSTLEAAPRRPAVARGRLRVRNGTPHNWIFTGGLWRCTLCSAFTRGNRERHDIAGCGGFSPLLRKVLLEPRFHALSVASIAGSSLVFCAGCGNWASSSGKRGVTDGGLSAACRQPPTPYGKRCLLRIASGKHPDPKRSDYICGTWSLSAAITALRSAPSSSSQ